MQNHKVSKNVSWKKSFRYFGRSGFRNDTLPY